MSFVERRKDKQRSDEMRGAVQGLDEVRRA